MDWLQFFAGIISSLAWPVAFLIALYALRGELVGLLVRVTRLKFPAGIEASFGEVLQEVQETVKEIAAERPTAVQAIEDPKTKQLIELAQRDPIAAIEQAYRDMYGKLSTRKLPKRRTSFNRIAYLAAIDAIDPHIYDIFAQLTRLRDFARYEKSGRSPPDPGGRTEKITTDEAIEYVRQARFLERLLEEALSKLPELTEKEYWGFGKIRPYQTPR